MAVSAGAMFNAVGAGAPDSQTLVCTAPAAAVMLVWPDAALARTMPSDDTVATVVSPDWNATGIPVSRRCWSSSATTDNWTLWPLMTFRGEGETTSDATRPVGPSM